MWPLGHAAIGYLCYSILNRSLFDRRPSGLSVIVVLIASQIPDLVDKPLAWYLTVLPTGRSLAHSLVVLLPLAIVSYLFARYLRWGAVGGAFGVGILAHTLTDAMPALWGDANVSYLFWPLLPVVPYDEGPPTIVGLLLESLGEPYFYLEFVLAGVAVLLWRADGCPGLHTSLSIMYKKFFTRG